MIPGSPSAGWRLPRGVSRQSWNRAADPDAVLQDERAASELHHADVAWVSNHLFPGCRLVDLGCGGGRLLEATARLCSLSLGIDISWPGLERSRQRLASESPNHCLLRSDLADLDSISDHQFDVGACLFSTLGMIYPAEARDSFLVHARRVLKPGGLFLVHAHNRWWHLGSTAGRQWLTRDAWLRLTGRPGAGEFRHPDAPASAPALTHYSRGELRNLLIRHGFELESIQPAQSPAGKSWIAYGWHAVARTPRA